MTQVNRGVTGNLLGIIHLLSFYGISPLVFPLDNEMKRFFRESRPEFERLLDLVCRASQLMPEFANDWVLGVLDDFIENSAQLYDREMVASYLALHYADRAYCHFTWDDPARFQREIEPILLRLVRELVGEILWTRLVFYHEHPEASLEAPLPLLQEVLVMISGLIPAAANLPPVPQMVDDSVSRWRQSSRLQNWLTGIGHQSPSFLRVIGELQVGE